MPTGEAHRLAELIRVQFGLTDLLKHLLRLLAAGRPVSVAEAAAAGGWTTAELRAELARHPGVDWDDAGRLVGLGLTLRPTPHSFSFDARTVYAFCASDALSFPVILRRPGVIESTCPATGLPVRVEVTPTEVVAVDPATAAVTKLRPDQPVADLRAEVCALGSFVHSPSAAAGWLAAHPQGAVAPIAEDFEITRQAMTELGWAAHHLTSPS